MSSALLTVAARAAWFWLGRFRGVPGVEVRILEAGDGRHVPGVNVLVGEDLLTPTQQSEGIARVEAV